MFLALLIIKSTMMSRHDNVQMPVFLKRSSFILSVTITSRRKKTIVMYWYSRFTSHYSCFSSEVVRSNRQEYRSPDNLCTARRCWIVATFRLAMPTNVLFAASSAPFEFAFWQAENNRDTCASLEIYLHIWFLYTDIYTFSVQINENRCVSLNEISIAVIWTRFIINDWKERNFLRAEFRRRNINNKIKFFNLNILFYNKIIHFIFFCQIILFNFIL